VPARTAGPVRPTGAAYAGAPRGLNRRRMPGVAGKRAGRELGEHERQRDHDAGQSAVGESQPAQACVPPRRGQSRVIDHSFTIGTFAKAALIPV
jgi:hypothetical protein